MKIRSRTILIASLLLAAGVIGFWMSTPKVDAQFNLMSSAPESPTPTPSPTATPSPTPIPLTAVVRESEVVSSKIDEIKRTTLSDSTVMDGRKQLKRQSEQLAQEEAKARRQLQGVPSLESVKELELQWNAYRSRIVSLQAGLSQFSNELDVAEKELAEMLRKWKELNETVDERSSLPDKDKGPGSEENASGNKGSSTKPSKGKTSGNEPESPEADASPAETPEPGMTVKEVPPAIRAKIDQTISDIEKAQNSIAEARTEMLDLQASISREEEKIDSVVAMVAEERRTALSNLISRDSPALWDPRSFAELDDGDIQTGFSAQWTSAREHVGENVGITIIVFILSLFILFGLRRAKRSTAEMVKEEPELKSTLMFFNSPVTSWALITLVWLSSSLTKTQEVVGVILIAAMLVPGYMILRKVIEAPLLPTLNVLTGFYLFDSVMELFNAYPFVYRVMFSVEMLLAMGILIWLYRRRPSNVALIEEHPNLVRYIKKAIFLCLFPIGFAFLGNLIGFLGLSRLVARGLFESAYSAMFLYALYLVLVGFAAYLARVRPLSNLRMMVEHKVLVVSKIAKLLKWSLILTWIGRLMDHFYLSDWISTTVSSIVSFPLTLGSFSIRLIDIFVFLFVVWLSFALSRLIAFVLEEDVYTRLSLKEGVPYAVSTILHYAVLFGGFTLAVLSLGLDLTKFTILAGAFGVGLAFGLQNIVENFISGVIILFERPIKVGDVIQRGQQVGDLKRIGLRASVLGTPEGAEVIVPNGVLLSEEVTNWTPASHHRRLDVNVGVKYGSDPEEVMRLLVGCAESHPEVATDPKPVSLFVGFGDSALDFQLRAWADSESRWWKIRSDITVAVYSVLNEAGIEIPFPQRDINLQGADSESLIGLLRKRASGEESGKE